MFRRWPRSDAMEGHEGLPSFVSCFFIPSSVSFPLYLLFRYSYSLIFILIFSSGLWLLVLVPFLSCCHFLIYGRFFFLCPFLVTRDKLLLSTPKFSLFHWGDGWVALCLFSSLPLFPSRLTWLIRTGVGGERGG